MSEIFELTRPESESKLPESVVKILKMEISLPEDERRDTQNEVEEDRQRQIIEKTRILSPAELAILENFRRKKKDLIRQNAVHYQGIMRVFKNEGRILGKEHADWRAVTRHSLVAELVAGELAKSLNARGASMDETAVRLAALLHDATKRLEFSDAALAYEQSGQGDRYTYSSLKLRELLEKDRVRAAIAKFHPDVAAVTRIAQVTGLPVLRQGQPGEHLDALEEKIIFYVDKILKHSAIVPLSERMADVARRYGHGKAPEELAYARTIETELADRLGLAPAEMPDFIQTLIINRINQHENPRG